MNIVIWRGYERNYKMCKKYDLWAITKRAFRGATLQIKYDSYVYLVLV